MPDAQTLTPAFASPFSTPAPPPDAQACAACGGALSASAPGGYWLHEGAARHPACVDWRGRAMPYLWALDRGRRALARLRHRGEPAPERLARAVRALEDCARAWPPPDPAGALLRAGAAADAVVEMTGR